MTKVNKMKMTTFISLLQDSGLQRGYIVNRNGNVTTSSTKLEKIAQTIINLPDYDNHDGIFFQIDKETGAFFLAAIHRTLRGNAQGGTRLIQYNTVDELFTDGLRLSTGMTQKNATAKIWWGGGKSIIYPPKHPAEITGEYRKSIFRNFGLFIASLNGLYVCAEDMNTTPEDMLTIHEVNRHVTCIPTVNGGSSNPSIFTANGVYEGIVAGLNFMDGTKQNFDLTGKHVIIQGVGNVGMGILQRVVSDGGYVTVTDTNINQLALIKSAYPDGNVVVVESLDKIYDIEADVFSPNAVGATINKDTISRLNVKLVAGAANNQLKIAKIDASRLHDKNILYIPDFVINRMGIVNCANEQYGHLKSEINCKLSEIYPSVIDLLEKSNKDNVSPYFKAVELANELSKEIHPIHGHRGILIIQDLLDRNWADDLK